MKKRTITAVDLFCGAGGASEGLLRACKKRGLKLELTGINHWSLAIEAHSKNHTLDPPYLPDVRSERWRRHAYRHEMSESDHRELAEHLHAIRGMAIVSGYPSGLYDEIFAGWVVVQHRTMTDVGRAIECLWLSPTVLDGIHQKRLL